MATVKISSSVASRPSVQRVAASSPSGTPIYIGAKTEMAAVCSAAPVVSAAFTEDVLLMKVASDTAANPSVVPATATSTGSPGIATATHASAEAMPAAGREMLTPARAARSAYSRNASSTTTSATPSR
jgi:hypothetical protein